MELALGFILIVVYLELKIRELKQVVEPINEIKKLISQVGLMQLSLKDLDSLKIIHDEQVFIKEKLTGLLKEVERVEKYRSDANSIYDVEL